MKKAITTTRTIFLDLEGRIMFDPTQKIDLRTLDQYRD